MNVCSGELNVVWREGSVLSGGGAIQDSGLGYSQDLKILLYDVEGY